MKINWFKIDKHNILFKCSYIIANSSLIMISNLLQYLKIGIICKDCEKEHDFCNCNYCNFCSEKFCVCNLDIEKFIVSFCKRNLSNDLIYSLNKYIRSTLSFKHVSKEELSLYMKHVNKIIKKIYEN